MGVGRIHLRRTFAELRADGVRRRSGPVSVTAIVDHGEVYARAAFAIGRSVGNAVDRNTLRRRLRAAMGDLRPAPGAYLISVTPGARGLPYRELRHHLERALPVTEAG
jgi:ribonuclease P protein component